MFCLDARGAHKLVSAHKQTHITHHTSHTTLITEINHRTITQQNFTTTLIVEGKKILGIQGGVCFSKYWNLE